MKDLAVWEIIKKEKKPMEQRCVKHHLVFDIKRNGLFHAHLVACGYSGTPGLYVEE